MLQLDYKAIGQRIKTRRKQLNMTQKQLAELLNLSEGSISRYEHGKVEDATMNKLKDFATHLHVDTTWLVGINEESEFETRVKAIIKKCEGLPSDVLIKILDNIENNVDIILKSWEDNKSWKVPLGNEAAHISIEYPIKKEKKESI